MSELANDIFLSVLQLERNASVIYWNSATLLAPGFNQTGTLKRWKVALWFNE